LAEPILRLIESRSSINFRSLPRDDPVHRRPDISLAKATLDWEPKVALEDGLKETITYFRVLLFA
jgi:UDP-glucuronate decarboxylase